jgi:hypothetical protein
MTSPCPRKGVKRTEEQQKQREKSGRVILFIDYKVVTDMLAVSEELSPGLRFGFFYGTISEQRYFFS